MSSFSSFTTCTKKGQTYLVPEGHSGVDDVLPVSADDDEPAVGVVGDVLRIDLAASHILHGEGEPLPVLHVGVQQRLQVRLLDLRVLRPDHLGGEKFNATSGISIV